MQNNLGGHPKSAVGGHLKTGQWKTVRKSLKGYFSSNHSVTTAESGSTAIMAISQK